MRIKIGISIMMALLVVISSCAVTTVSAEEDPTPIGLEVVKEVRPYGEKCDWFDEIYAEVGDYVEFKILITYHAPDDDYWIENVVVTDTLPPCLEFYEWEPIFDIDFEVDDNVITWDFGEERFYNNSVITLYFSAEVVDYGKNVNHAEVTAKQTCGKIISGEDTATVKVYGVKLEKTVWDPDTQEWVELLDGVIKDVDVRFQLKITYYQDPENTTKCMIVEDLLPMSCLEYIDTEEIIYPNDEFGDPEIIVSEDLKYIIWDWSQADFYLQNEKSIIIIFTANVTEYCYDERCIVENWAHVELTGYGHEYDDDDIAQVNCRPHDPVFEKTVLYKGEWVDETYTYVDEEVQFKLDLTYYGDYNLTDIVITDYLPEAILTYVGPTSIIVTYVGPTSIIALVTIPIEWGVEVSEDGKIITWDTSASLNDSETLTIKFKALVIGSTGSCKECGTNVAEYSANESCTEKPFDSNDTAQVHAGDKIEISICVNKRFHIGRVSASIKNIGHEDLEDVDWTIDVTGGVFKRVNESASGTIESLPEGAPAKVSLGWRSILRRGGLVTIVVTATPAGAGTIQEEFTGIVIGRIILVRPLIRIFG